MDTSRLYGPSKTDMHNTNAKTNKSRTAFGMGLNFGSRLAVAAT